MVEAETLLLLPLQGTVIFQGGLEHGKGAHDIGGHEIPRIVNGTVHVGLRRQVHHPIRSVFPQGVPHQGGVPNVGVQEAVRRRIRRAVQGTDVAGISQGVNIQDFMAALKQQPDQIGADESGAAVTITFITLFSGKDAAPSYSSGRVFQNKSAHAAGNMEAWARKSGGRNRGTG